MSTPVRLTRRQFVRRRGRRAGRAVASHFDLVPACGAERSHQPRLHRRRHAWAAATSAASWPRDVQVVAVCDVVDHRRDDAKQTVEEALRQGQEGRHYKGCAAYNDFRELLGRKDIDAVVIATPDHWHAIPCIEAAQGREAHLLRKAADARPSPRAARSSRRCEDTSVVFQTGSQQRSEFGGHFRKAVEYVRNGRIGKLKTITSASASAARPVPCDLPDQQTPAGTDWDLLARPGPEARLQRDPLPAAASTSTSRTGGTTANTPAAAWPTWGPTTSTSPSGRSTWTAAARSRSSRPKTRRPSAACSFVYANGVEMIHGGASGIPTAVFEGSRRHDLRRPRRHQQRPGSDPRRPARRQGRSASTRRATTTGTGWSASEPQG